jgi:anti-sigma B factor antagonist
MKLESRTYTDVVVVAAAGRLDHDNCDAFRAGLQPHLDRAGAASHRMVLDLSGLEYVSSAGLRCFMLAAKQANAKNGKIAVAAPRPVVAEIFEISRFNMVLRVFPSMRDALGFLSADAAAAFGQG